MDPYVALLFLNRQHGGSADLLYMMMVYPSPSSDNEKDRGRKLLPPFTDC